MKIRKIETIPYRIPYTRPLSFATGTITAVENVFVRIHTDEGIVGEADAPARPYIYGESQQSIITAINQWFLPSLNDIDLLDNEKVGHAMAWVTDNPAARAAVDLAIWDATGKYRQMSCGQLLGGWCDEIRVSHMIGHDLPPKMAESAVSMAEKYGINTFKVKTGTALQTDILACKLIRKALPEANLYLDANHGWSSAEAIAAGLALKDERFLFFEEPSPAADRIGRRRLNQHLGLPVCGDESCRSLEEVGMEISDNIASMICIKTARTGFSESRKIAALCEGLNVPVYVGNQGDTKTGTLANIHFACSLRHTSLYAAELTNFLDIADDLHAEDIPIVAGKIKRPATAGMGISIDPGKLSYYRCDK